MVHSTLTVSPILHCPPARRRAHGESAMNFEEILDHAIAMLQRRGRVTYRTLKRQFQLADDALEDLKEELIYGQRLAADEDGRVLVWMGEEEPICAYLWPFPPTSPSRHVWLTPAAWARSLCQPCPHRAFLMPPTPRPAAQKAA